MESTFRLYDTLFAALGQHGKWLDVRHLKTLAWMMVGRIQSEKVGLTHWIPFVQGRAQMAQSTQRRFRRWLYNERIHVNDLYGPVIQAALAEWGVEALYLALDTSMLYAVGRVLPHPHQRGLSGASRAFGLEGVGPRQQQCSLQCLSGVGG